MQPGSLTSASEHTTSPRLQLAWLSLAVFLGMTLYAQRVYPVAYQWRRVVTALGAGVGLTVAARAGQLGLAPSLLLVLAYPLALALLGFFLPAERARLRRLVPLFR